MSENIVEQVEEQRPTHSACAYFVGHKQGVGQCLFVINAMNRISQEILVDCPAICVTHLFIFGFHKACRHFTNKADACTPLVGTAGDSTQIAGDGTVYEYKASSKKQN